MPGLRSPGLSGMSPYASLSEAPQKPIQAAVVASEETLLRLRFHAPVLGWMLVIENEGERKKEKEKEKHPIGTITSDKPSDSGTNGSEGAKAEAEKAPPKAPERLASRPKRKRKDGKPRGGSDLSPDLARLVRVVGRDKVVPDTTALERHYSRSLRFRHKILEFLLDNRDTVWIDIAELHAQAANYAGCASQTAARWIYQLTRQDAPFRLREAVDRWVLERRE